MSTGKMNEAKTHPPPKDNSNDNANLSRQYESLVVASANITLTMLRRGELLEADLNRALDHVRESNKHLKEFVQLLEAVDGDRWNERERVGSWIELAERVRSVKDKDDHRHGHGSSSRSGANITENHPSNSDAEQKGNPTRTPTVEEGKLAIPRTRS